jgi:hypothetical protein
MQLLNSFFGIVFLLTIVICGVTWLFSAHQGIRIARGLALAVLPFFIGTIAMPSPGTSLPWGGVQIVIAFTILLAALFASANTHSVGDLLKILVAIGLIALISGLGIELFHAMIAN